VGSNLSSIAIFVELLRKKVKEQPELLPILNKITDNSEETVSLMRDTVWAISPSNDSTEKLLEKMRSFGFEILSAKGIAFDFKSEIETKKDLFSMEQRRNIYLIYKEAINNIAKHSAATKAFCHVSNQNGATQFEIYDNGKGFDPNQSFEGNGLKNYQIRSQDEDLHVSLHSAPDNGTTVLIKVF
jgi:signal transduction histidine kinase